MNMFRLEGNSDVGEATPPVADRRKMGNNKKA